MQRKNTSSRTELLELARMRGTRKTFCPSEVARNLLQGDWQSLMRLVESEGKKMVSENLLICTLKGKNVDPILARGLIRVGLCPDSLIKKT